MNPRRRLLANGIDKLVAQAPGLRPNSRVARDRPTSEMTLKYAVIFEPAETNWAAYVPDLPGCITTGTTLDETDRNIREAIEGHLKTLSEFGDPIPRPTTVARNIDIQAAA